MTCLFVRDLIEISKDGEWGQPEPALGLVPMLCIRGTDFEAVRTGSLAGVPLRHVAQRAAAVKTLKPWDVLIETAGGTKDQITGRTVLLRPSLFERTDTRLGCASFSRFMRFDSGLCDPAFVFWYLQFLYTTGVLNAYHTQHTGVARFQWTTFASSERIALPTIDVQSRIAGVLLRFDELIENNVRRVAILDQLVSTVFREWFPYQASLNTDGPSTGVPSGWDKKSLGQLAEEVRRNVPKGDLEGDTHYVGLEHIPRRSLALDDWVEVSELGSNKLAFKTGEVLFGKIRPYFHKVIVAPFDGVCSADTIVLGPGNPEDYGLVVAVVSSDAFVQHATATSNGAKMPRASWSVLREYPVLVPSLGVRRRFSEFVRNVVALQRNLVLQNRNLRQTRDLLLPRLLSGQIELPHAEEAAGTASATD